MNPLDIIAKYYPVGSEAYRILVIHSRSVADKALAIARMHPEMNLDLTFVEEAAMLHDIGIFRCNAPDIDCHGDAEYICHGYLGAELMAGGRLSPPCPRVRTAYGNRYYAGND